MLFFIFHSIQFLLIPFSAFINNTPRKLQFLEEFLLPSVDGDDYISNAPLKTSVEHIEVTLESGKTVSDNIMVFRIYVPAAIDTSKHLWVKVCFLTFFHSLFNSFLDFKQRGPSFT